MKDDLKCFQIRAAGEDGPEVRGQDPRGVQDGARGEVRERVRGGLQGRRGEARLHEHPAAGVPGEAQAKVPEGPQETLQEGTSCFIWGFDGEWRHHITLLFCGRH